MATDWSDEIVVADLGDEPALSEELNALIERIESHGSEETPHLVLNCANMTYLNSSNIAQLLKLRNRLNERERSMKLCAVGDEVWSIMLVTGLDKVFRFAPDTMTALAGLQIEGEDDPDEGSAPGPDGGPFED